MTRKQKAAIWYQKVILRGIEGLLSDKFIAQALNQPGLDGLHDHFEAKYMAEALYAQLSGLSL